MAKLFGFSIEDTEPLSPTTVSPVPPNDEDGVDHYMSSGFFGSYVDLEGVYRTEFELIKRYREMAIHPECDSAIEDIVNEAIVSDSNDQPVELDLNHLNIIQRLVVTSALPLLNEGPPPHSCLRNTVFKRDLFPGISFITKASDFEVSTLC